ncbi:MAG TPA: RIP metalloprotease RseP [Aliidongia sp.]|nr:RIP metalloprotease RseP [Aliidongia sp.]
MSYLTGTVETVVPFLIVLTVLVFVHELGHYLVARWCGVRVETFSVGFGPELIGRFDRNGTRWKLSAIPFGGYVKMYGDADAASMPGEQLATMTPEERAVSFHWKPLPARAAIIAAGPAANFLFTIVVLAGLFSTVGQSVTPSEIGEVRPGSAAEAVGLQKGDMIFRVNGTSIDRFQDLVRQIQLNTGTPVELGIRRAGQELDIQVTPKITELTDLFGNKTKVPLLGVSPAADSISFERRDPFTAVVEAGRETWGIASDTLTGLMQMITGARPADGLHGPLGIADLSRKVAQSGVVSLLSFMALLSVNLGLVNLFPIPVLDGGHLLFYAAEALRGRPLGQRAQEVGFRLGLALVLTLMVFATWNDLVQFHVWPFSKV